MAASPSPSAKARAVDEVGLHLVRLSGLPGRLRARCQAAAHSRQPGPGEARFTARTGDGRGHSAPAAGRRRASAAGRSCWTRRRSRPPRVGIRRSARPSMGVQRCTAPGQRRSERNSTPLLRAAAAARALDDGAGGDGSAEQGCPAAPGERKLPEHGGGRARVYQRARSGRQLARPSAMLRGWSCGSLPRSNGSALSVFVMASAHRPGIDDTGDSEGSEGDFTASSRRRAAG